MARIDSVHLPSPFAAVRRLLSLVLLLALLAGPARAVAGDSRHPHPNPHALWQIVHDRCVPAARLRHPPSPCTRLWLAHGVQRGYALLKDRRGREQYLLIPTARVSGIESPRLRGDVLPNYFAAAWAARHYVGAALGRSLPRDDVALAINSRVGRSQDQLHIHIDCVREDVRRRLDRLATTLGAHWSPVPGGLLGHRYRALRVDGRALASNPFHLLATALPAGHGLGDWTLVVVGQTFAGGRPGFVILASRASAHNHASGEELMDHACALGRVSSHRPP